MPLILSMMDDLSKGQPVSSTYLELWCRTFDESSSRSRSRGRDAQRGFLSRIIRPSEEPFQANDMRSSPSSTVISTEFCERHKPKESHSALMPLRRRRPHQPQMVRQLGSGPDEGCKPG